MSDSTESTGSGRAMAKPCSPTKKTRRAPAASARIATKTKKLVPTASGSRTVAGASTGLPPALVPTPKPSPGDAQPTQREPACVTPEASDAGTPESGTEYHSASSTPDPLEPRSRRRSSESDLALITSTPDINNSLRMAGAKTHSEASLLRIKAQLRAAVAANLESSIRAAEEPRDTEVSEGSIISDIAVAGNGALHDMPRLANALLQQTKSRMEESRNTRSDIKEAVVAGLHGLHEMILRLADSRNRHIAEKERLRASYERRLNDMQTKHATALQGLIGTQQKASGELMEAVKAVHKEAEAARWISLEAEQLNKDNAKTIGDLVARVSETTRGGVGEAVGTIQEDIAMLRLELGTLAMTTCPTPSQPAAGTVDSAVSAADVRGIRSEIEHLRQEVRDAKREFGPLQPVGQPTRPADRGEEPTPKTYAQIVSRPQHGVILESTDPRKTSGDIIDDVKRSVDVINLGIGVNRVAKLSRQRVIINCDSEEDRLTLKKAIQEKTDKLTIGTPTARKPLLKLMGLVTDISDNRVVEAVFRQNGSLVGKVDQQDTTCRVVRRTKGRTSQVVNVILEVSAQLWQALRDQKLRIGYQVVTAVDQSPVTQCYKCLGFGHFSRECNNESTCGHCAENHDTRKCPARAEAPKCINCAKSGGAQSGDHAAYSQYCPEWRKWDRIARSSVAYCC